MVLVTQLPRFTQYIYLKLTSGCLCVCERESVAMAGPVCIAVNKKKKGGGVCWPLSGSLQML